MMRWVVASSLKFRLLILPIAAALMFVGFTRLPDTPVDTLPEFVPPTVQIQTEALGLSAVEVEQLVTVPLEQDLLNGVAWLDEIRSTSVAGLSSIDMIFEAGTDILRARQMVQERLTQAHALPNVSKPPVMVQPVSSTSRVMMVSLSSPELSLIDMSVLARWRVKPRLMGVPGVANVSIWGQRERQLQVQIDPEKLAQSGVTLDQVIATSGNALWVSPLTFVEASTPGTAGFVDTPNQRLTIQHILPIRTPQDLAQVRLEDTDKPVRIGDVATVVEDHQPLIGDAVVNDGAGLILVIEKFPGANTLEVTRGLEETFAALRPGLSGVKVDTTVYHPAGFIERAVGNLTTWLLLALLLVIVIVGAFLFDWRTGLISVVAIPLSLVAAALVLHLREGGFNLLVLTGLVMALGVIIDDAIVDIENIRRRLREHRTADRGRSTAAVIVAASLEVRGTLAFATVILVVAALPALFLSGLIGAFSGPLALSYILAILAALAVALTVTPALALLLLARQTTTKRGESPMVRPLRRGYSAALSRLVPRAGYAVVVVVLLLLAGGLAAPMLSGSAMLPAMQDRDLLIRWDGPPSMSRPEMVRITEQASRELRAIPGVRQVAGHVGRATTSDRVVAVNSGELWISINRSADYPSTVSKIRAVVRGYPGFTSSVQTYPENRVNEVRTGSGADLVVRVYGQDLNVIRDKAQEVRQVLAQIDGVFAPRIEVQAEEPTVEIEVNLAAAQQHGLKPGDVRRATATLLSGLQVGNLFEDQKVFDVVVWGVPASRHSVSSIRELLIDTPNGGHVRLKDVADVRIKPNLTAVKHDSVSRRLDITADVRGRSVDAVARDVEAGLRNINFPIEYHAEVLGGYAERAAARQRMVWLALAALVAIPLLLQAAFGSWRAALLLFVSLPAALVGGVLVAYAGGFGTSLASLVGLFGVFGIALRHGMLLIRHCQHLETDEGETFGPQLVLRGAQERMAPVLLTTLTLGFALLPVALLGNGPGGEVLRPMALVFLGGLVTSAVLNLFILPALYLRFGSRRPAGDRTPNGATVIEGDRAPATEPPGPVEPATKQQAPA